MKCNSCKYLFAEMATINIGHILAIAIDESKDYFKSWNLRN